MRIPTLGNDGSHNGEYWAIQIKLVRVVRVDGLTPQKTRHGMTRRWIYIRLGTNWSRRVEVTEYEENLAAKKTHCGHRARYLQRCCTAPTDIAPSPRSMAISRPADTGKPFNQTYQKKDEYRHTS
jgi:hypothetical protein